MKKELYIPPLAEITLIRPGRILDGSQGSTENYNSEDVWDGDDID